MKTTSFPRACWLTHSLMHSLTRARMHALTHSLIHSLNERLHHVQLGARGRLGGSTEALHVLRVRDVPQAVPRDFLPMSMERNGDGNDNATTGMALQQMLPARWFHHIAMIITSLLPLRFGTRGH